MQPAVAGEQAELAPALVHIRRGGGLEAGDVVAPEAEAAVAHAQPGTEGFRHGDIAGAVVAAPVHGELLPPRRGAAGKEDGLALAAHLAEQVKDHFVVQEGVVVVHVQRVGAVEVADVPDGDALAEIGLETMKRFADACSETAVIEKPAKLEGRNMLMFLAPKTNK